MRRLLLLAIVSLSAHAQSFEVATVRPSHADPAQGHWSLPGTGRFDGSALTLTWLIRLAYGVDSTQIANQPGWLDSDLFDIAAKPEAGVTLTSEELQPRLQKLLAERFHLAVHQETRMLPGYALVVAKDGPHLPPGEPGKRPNIRRNVSRGHAEGINWTMPFLAQMLTPALGFPVVDETNLPGSYDISLRFAADRDTDSEADSDKPSLFAAIRETLGLELKSRKVPVRTIVIDHVDRTPTEN